MTTAVFTYGSNMCSARLRKYGVAPEGPGLPCILKDFRLCLNKPSTDGSAKANVERHNGSVVWGVLYTLSDSDLLKLDKGEGEYHRVEEEIFADSNSLGNAWVYIANKPTLKPLRPYGWYQRFMVEGAREHELPAPYIEILESLDADEDPDKERDRTKRNIKCERGR